MSRLVVISNRLPSVQESGTTVRADLSAGGLASAIFTALKEHPGSLWIGWSGGIAERDHDHRGGTSKKVEGVDLLGIPLTRREYEDYYLGFCNRTLWPLLHCFQSKVRISVRQERRYRQVEQQFASVATALLRPDDLVWVHDYHHFLFARELRRLGWKGRIGFFLHTPFPPHELWQLLPDPADFMEALLDYDLIGFHVRRFLENYVVAAQREIGAEGSKETLIAGGRSQRLGVYPVGIGPGEFSPAKRRTDSPPPVLRPFLPRRRIIIGVDRLDYTKGIPERFLAIEKLLHRFPHLRRDIVYIQIASPSRSSVPEYSEQRIRVESLVGRVNGEIGEPDWTPITYLYRTYSRRVLAQIYREADVGLVTPLRDGMNLVAKEFIASQDPEAPGVLVLSRSAGAADDLREAVIVNSFVPSEVATGIARALSMPLEERRDRHAALAARVWSDTAEAWTSRFVRDLADQEMIPSP